MGVDQQTYRAGLKELDACLTDLEEAHERNELTVSSELASKLGEIVSGIAPGMIIADAIELIFERQAELQSEKFFASSAVASGVGSTVVREMGAADVASEDRADISVWNALAPDPPITVVGALRLTEQIRLATRVACLLMLQAYEQRAWFALAYRSWEEYVRREFGIRRSRAYQLLDHARIIRALQEAAGTSEVPDISAYATDQVKPYLTDILETVQARVAASPRSRAVEVIVEVIRERRRPLANGPIGASRAVDVATWSSDHLRRLFDAIDCLAELPVAAHMLPGSIDLGELNRALQWLVEFEETCVLRMGIPRS